MKHEDAIMILSWQDQVDKLEKLLKMHVKLGSLAPADWVKVLGGKDE